jgi:hypothetical protein
MPFIGFLAIRWNVDGIDNSIIIYWPLALYEVQHSKRFRERIHQRCSVPGQFASASW